MRPVNVLICALGGEGGGVLAEWLYAAAVRAGHAAQATSIPGVAQRTGQRTGPGQQAHHLDRHLHVGDCSKTTPGGLREPGAAEHRGGAAAARWGLCGAK